MRGCQAILSRPGTPDKMIVSGEAGFRADQKRPVHAGIFFDQNFDSARLVVLASVEMRR